MAGRAVHRTRARCCAGVIEGSSGPRRRWLRGSRLAGGVYPDLDARRAQCYRRHRRAWFRNDGRDKRAGRHRRTRPCVATPAGHRWAGIFPIALPAVPGRDTRRLGCRWLGRHHHSFVIATPFAAYGQGTNHWCRQRDDREECGKPSKDIHCDECDPFNVPARSGNSSTAVRQSPTAAVP